MKALIMLLVAAFVTVAAVFADVATTKPAAVGACAVTSTQPASASAPAAAAVKVAE